MLRLLPLLYAAVALHFRRAMPFFGFFFYIHLHMDAGAMNRNEEKTLQYARHVGVQLHAIDIAPKQPKIVSNQIIFTILD